MALRLYIRMFVSNSTELDTVWVLWLAILAVCCQGSHSAPLGEPGGASAAAGANSSGGMNNSGGTAFITGGASSNLGGASGGARASGGSAGRGQSGASNGGASNGGTGGAHAGAAAGGAAPAATGGQAGTSDRGTLSERYPDDASLAADPAVLFQDDFENGWGRWNAPKSNTEHLFLESNAALAHRGSHYLRSTVTEAALATDQYISSSTELTFAKRVETVFIRFHAYFKGLSPNPHHWVRVAAGTPTYASSGLANTVPPGAQGFWFDFDADIDDHFSFYAYWYKMRSGRCNDGTATPGCPGDQGTTYYYGNTFQPPGQSAFERDHWLCIEVMARANSLGTSDGALAFWLDQDLVGDYRPGFPNGTWLRDKFFAGGCTFSACTEPKPFQGFDFRSSTDVLFKSFFLDAYYERDTTTEHRRQLEERGLTVSSEQTILYDDVVVATTRIGCRG